jgi:hypothetical protein
MVGPLERVADRHGTVTLGWLTDSVLYARFSGELSASLGQAYAARLHALVRAESSIRYFADASALEQYDLLARSAFVRVVLANRPKFASLTILTWSEGLGLAAQRFAASLQSAEMVTDGKEFERRLFQFAPHAKQKLDPNTWVPMEVVTLP